MGIFKHKMLIVAVVAGFCGFLLRSATAPATDAPAQPVVALSAVARDANPAAGVKTALDGLGKQAEGLVASLREKAFGHGHRHDDEAEGDGFIALPEAAEAATVVAVLSLPAGLPSLEQAAPLAQVAAPGAPALETALPQRPAARPAAPARRVAAASHNAQPRKYREMWATVTAYCPCSRCCGARARGRTSLGGSAWLPGIAADPRALPYGTAVYVPGYGEHTVDDTGGAMRESWRNHGRLHLDIRMKTHYEARQWGRRTMKVRVYGK